MSASELGTIHEWPLLQEDFILPHANDKAMPFSMSPSLRPPWNRKQSPIVAGEWAVRDLPSVYLSALVEKGEFQGCLMKQGDGR